MRDGGRFDALLPRCVFETFEARQPRVDECLETRDLLSAGDLAHPGLRDFPEAARLAKGLFAGIGDDHRLAPRVAAALYRDQTGRDQRSQVAGERRAVGEETRGEFADA